MLDTHLGGAVRRIRLLGLISAVALLLAACGGSDETSSPSGGQQQAAPTGKCNNEKLRFQLSFFANAQHAGFLVAQNRGFYKEEGLNLEVVPGGPNVNVPLALAQGNVDVAMMGDDAVLSFAGGAGITVVAQTYRTDPTRFVALKKSGITSPADLKGKRVGVQRVGKQADLLALLNGAGLKESDIKMVPINFGIEDIVSGKVDIGSQQLFFHKAAWEAAGYKWPDDLVVIDPAKFGVEVYGQVIAVNNHYLEANRAAVACFLRASVRGWQTTIADPDSAVKDVMKFLPAGSSTEQAQLVSLKVTDDELMAPPGFDKANLMKVNPSQVQATADTMQRFAILKRHVDTTKLVDTSFLGALSG
jgi:NitT/TauT family transport system substrate-binding protein